MKGIILVLRDKKMIAENIKIVKKNINEALSKSKFNNDVTLICVSKTKPVEMIIDAYEAGERNFGENKVQEIVAKAPLLPEDTVWHMIGHLQTNKVKKAVQYAEYIHSVDSLSLAQAIDKEAGKTGKIQKILCEVNIASEDSKFGLNEDSLIDLLIEISKLQNIKICGLMCVAPYTEISEENRKYFVKLREMMNKINQMNIENVNMNMLSMGMTNDYMIAIEEGATFIRVGTGIFGERNYNI